MRALILIVGIVLSLAALVVSTLARLATTGRIAARIVSGTLATAALAAGLALLACDEGDHEAAPAAVSEGHAAPAAAPAADQASIAIPPEAGGSANPNDRPLPLMYFQGHGVNPFIDADEDPLSTFALDGDTASYEILALYLGQHALPPPEAVRVEEFVNSLPQDYPTAEGALGLHLDAAPSPFGPEGYVLLRVGVSNPAPPEERGPVSLIFVVDVSGSMGADNRIGVAAEVIAGLAGMMTSEDRAALVSYGSRASVVSDFADAASREEIVSAARTLGTGGSTYAEEGLRLAYRLAAAEIERGRQVRIVLLSDGVANVGATGPESILKLVDVQAQRNATLTAIGVGISGNYNDVLLEALANRGNGAYHYLADRAAADRFLGERAAGVFTETARDARIQLEFNPDTVRKYRLIGYENRAVSDEDFRDDSLDFGEPGFARDVTALYELRLEEGAAPDSALATARLRWLNPSSGRPVEVEAAITVAAIAADITAASPHFRQTAAAAEFAELLRTSYWAQCGSLDAVSELLAGVGSELGEHASHATLVRRVRAASELFTPYCS
ncbi:MAG: DUF3520 domain-containing protein, partial [Chloroflexi bacterium]|nr:DUF3520 domain-containing protein [Chloroflexota bacterium]